MRVPLMAGNWKMYKSVGEAIALVQALKESLAEVADREILVCPPFTALYPVAETLKGSNIELGAQNIYPQEEGAYTGEISPTMLVDVGCRYVIVGHSERMANDPYVLPHLANGDFEEGTVGWEVSLAEEGGISTGSMSGLSWLEGRYPKTSQGDTYLLMKRSQKAPNRVSQALRALTPGRLYSLRFLSADIGDLSQQQKLALSVTLSGAEVLPDKQFQHVFANCYSHHLGPYDDKNHAWMNYHWLVFKATGPEARLTIADWLDDRTPGGPVGQQLAVNFVQVQPYDAP